MKIFLPIALILVLTLTACGSSAERLVNDGNKAFEQQNYPAALTDYQQAQAESPELAEPHYNAANTYYRQEDYEAALKEIEQTLVKDDGDLVQDSFYNLGNNFFQAQKPEQAIEAYKEALRLNPDDVEAKHNLELALQQQQQNEEQNDQQNQDQQEQQDNQNQQEQQQNNQNQDENRDQDQEQQDQPNGQPQQVEGLTADQARQLLQAASKDTESLEEHLQQIMVAPGGPPAVPPAPPEMVSRQRP